MALAGIYAPGRTGLLLPIALVLAAGCSSSTGSPNVTPGQCVLSNGVWYCGTGYGNFRDCDTWEAGTCDKTQACFSCAYGSAGETCTCWPGDAATCLPSETGCTQ